MVDHRRLSCKWELQKVEVMVSENELDPSEHSA